MLQWKRLWQVPDNWRGRTPPVCSRWSSAGFSPETNMYILSHSWCYIHSMCLREIKVGAGQTKGSWDSRQTACVFKVAIVYCKWAVCVNNSADTNGTELKWENKKHHIGPRPTSRSKEICIKLLEGRYRDCKKL